MHVLFVCTGNICRSPTAERLSAMLASRSDVGEYRFSSAGVRAVRGHPIYRDAAIVLERLGGSAKDFAARQITPKIADDCDLIVTMTRNHRDAVLEIAPRRLRQTFTLAEIALLVTEFGVRSVAELADFRPQIDLASLADIEDPIGQDPGVFSKVGCEIFGLIPPILMLSR